MKAKIHFCVWKWPGGKSPSCLGNPKPSKQPCEGILLDIVITNVDYARHPADAKVIDFWQLWWHSIHKDQVLTSAPELLHDIYIA